MNLIAVRADPGPQGQGARYQAGFADALTRSTELAGIYLALALAWAVLNVMKRFGATF